MYKKTTKKKMHQLDPKITKDAHVVFLLDQDYC